MPLFGYSTSMHFSLKTLATQAVRDLLEAMTELASTWVGLSCLVSPKSCVLLPIRMILRSPPRTARGFETHSLVGREHAADPAAVRSKSGLVPNWI
jgi:hypothetical protein